MKPTPTMQRMIDAALELAESEDLDLCVEIRLTPKDRDPKDPKEDEDEDHEDEEEDEELIRQRVRPEALLPPTSKTTK